MGLYTYCNQAVVLANWVLPAFECVNGRVYGETTLFVFSTTVGVVVSDAASM